MVMMFVEGVVLLFDEISVLFLQKKIYGAGVFHSRVWEGTKNSRSVDFLL